MIQRDVQVLPIIPQYQALLFKTGRLEMAMVVIMVKVNYNFLLHFMQAG